MASTHRPFPSLRIAKALLSIDCVGGLAVGVLVLTLSSWLSTLYGMPERFVIALGVANIAYGAFALSLARRAVRPRALLLLLGGANLAWAVFCVIASAILASRASAYGLALLLFEGAYVGGLGLLEWRCLDSLLTKG